MRRWEKSDLADGIVPWVSMKKMSISLWNDQFFSFAVVDFGQFLGASPAMDSKLNLKSAAEGVLQHRLSDPNRIGGATFKQFLFGQFERFLARVCPRPYGFRLRSILLLF